MTQVSLLCYHTTVIVLLEDLGASRSNRSEQAFNVLLGSLSLASLRMTEYVRTNRWFSEHDPKGGASECMQLSKPAANSLR